MNQYLMEIQSERKLFAQNVAFYQQRVPPQALDLSLRRFSVETPCKTPSPYNESSFGEGSPSTSHDSPTTTSSSDNQRKHLSRSDTPLRHYPSPTESLNMYGSDIPTDNHQSFQQHNGQSEFSPKRFEYEMREMKREVVSPGSNCDQEVTSPTSSVSKTSHMTPFMINAIAFQKQMAQVQLLSDETPETPKSPSSNSISPPSLYPMMMGRDGKLARPFKAYPRDPLSISASFNASDSIIDTDSAEKYQAYRKRMLQQIHAANGGQPTISNPKMRRTSKPTSLHTSDFSLSPSSTVNASLMHVAAAANAAAEKLKNDQRLSDDAREAQDANDSNNNHSDSGSVKDSAYFERRKKNNAAAKKSRDRRRIKEDEIAIRAAFLERENLELKYQVSALQKQVSLYQHQYGINANA